MTLQPFVSLYQYALEPVAPFSWFGLPISSLDLLGAFRLCYVLRQIRENLRNEHVKRRAADSKLPALEERSFARDALTTLTVVYGGEAITGPLLGIPPSFMVSGVYPVLYVLMQALVDSIPVLPPMALTTELPLSFLDGHTRAMLLCSLIPPAILSASSPVVASSPWALLLSSLVITNGGFFLTGLFSFLHPTPLALTTPSELLPYGWTTTDLWSAPLVTGLYATLTHAQPFWADIHAVLSGMLGGATQKVAPLDAETARTACALVLAGLFATRTAKTYGVVWKQGVAEKIKTS
ncbi:hypothetical protein HYDPIDRAFT_29533 [Hydnomerulius pinastri MD-312]|uniref:Uncharacterized protein n=1 Tax=Hydnomerulius pinastri MD-312 TaxID=994086 RepID=A0A0C9W7P5_9AGAM|nr:hypothetical protein HYDPIDRAFT_29533 [Hydnomerulius pinastri MD-312]